MVLPIRLLAIVICWPVANDVKVSVSWLVEPISRDLANLGKHLGVVHRIQRVLVLHFSDQQSQELVQVDIAQIVASGFAGTVAAARAVVGA